METENKLKKFAKTGYTVTKALYFAACALCLIFIVLAIALSCTDAIKTLTKKETAILFATLAFYSFMSIGLLWNIQEIFNTVRREGTPFCERVLHYLKKTAIFFILVSTVPAIVGTALLRIICPATEIVFPIELFGALAGIGLLIAVPFLKCGIESINKNK